MKYILCYISDKKWSLRQYSCDRSYRCFNDRNKALKFSKRYVKSKRGILYILDKNCNVKEKYCFGLTGTE